MDNVSSSHVEHVAELLHEMIKTKNQSDVTLVCDDNRLIKAHKSVLSACCEVFRRIFSDINPLDSLIHLTDIQHEEMESILEFMYLGVTSFDKKRMNEFFNVAKNLEIKEISNSIEFDKSKETESIASFNTDQLDFVLDNMEAEEEDEKEQETTITDEKEGYSMEDYHKHSKDKDEIDTCERQQNKINTKDSSSTCTGDLSTSEGDDENSSAENTSEIHCDPMAIQEQNNMYDEYATEETEETFQKKNQNLSRQLF